MQNSERDLSLRKSKGRISFRFSTSPIPQAERVSPALAHCGALAKLEEPFDVVYQALRQDFPELLVPLPRTHVRPVFPRYRRAHALTPVSLVVELFGYLGVPCFLGGPNSLCFMSGRIPISWQNSLNFSSSNPLSASNTAISSATCSRLLVRSLRHASSSS